GAANTLSISSSYGTWTPNTAPRRSSRCRDSIFDIGPPKSSISGPSATSTPASLTNLPENSRRHSGPFPGRPDWPPPSLKAKQSGESALLTVCRPRSAGGNPFGAPDVRSIMDQRTDNERRQDTAPGREAKPAIGETRKTQSWLGGLRQRRRMVLVITALLIAALVGLVVWWVNAGNHETTDDAFIDARTVQISAQVSAAIVEVPVTDNQMVE